MFQKGDRVIVRRTFCAAFHGTVERVRGSLAQPVWYTYEVVEDDGTRWECRMDSLELEDPFAQWVKEVRNDTERTS